MGIKIKKIIKKIRLKRTTVLVIVFIFLSSVLVRQLFSLQIIQGEDYISKFQTRTTKTRVIKSTRGNIYDRNGTVVASNVLAYSVTFEDSGTYNSTREKNLTLNGIAYQVLQILSNNRIIGIIRIILTKGFQFLRRGLACVTEDRRHTLIVHIFSGGRVYGA